MKQRAKNLTFTAAAVLLAGFAGTPQLAHADDYRAVPFTTDGCTLFPDGTLVNPTLWRDCCVIHDLRYWFGGQESPLRSQANAELADCVDEHLKAAHSVLRIGDLMAFGTKIGGTSHLPTAWRWGYAFRKNNRPELGSLLSIRERMRQHLGTLRTEIDTGTFDQKYGMTPKGRVRFSEILTELEGEIERSSHPQLSR